MADPDSSWMFDDDVVEDVAAADGEVNDEATEEVTTAKPADAPKPPAAWRTTYKLDVSNITVLLTHLFLHNVYIRKFGKY